MKTTALTLLLATLALSTGASPASALSWNWSSSFRIGHLSFHLGYHDHHSHRGYYYRVQSPIRSRARCTDRCYVERGTYYHHESCPVVHSYFRGYGYEPQQVFEVYSPFRAVIRGRSDRHYDSRYDHYDHYDHYDRRYDSRHRSRGHYGRNDWRHRGHHSDCDHDHRGHGHSHGRH